MVYVSGNISPAPKDKKVSGSIQGLLMIQGDSFHTGVELSGIFALFSVIGKSSGSQYVKLFTLVNK